VRGFVYFVWSVQLVEVEVEVKVEVEVEVEYGILQFAEFSVFGKVLARISPCKAASFEEII